MHCIGIDVSKQELVAYDGRRLRTFPNTSALTELAAFLGKRDGEVTVVFEPTSTYSRPLELLCQTQKIRCWRLNPRVIPHLREVTQGRSKTDRTDAELLWQYGQDHGPGERVEEDGLGHGLKACLSCYAQAQKARIACQELGEALSHDPATPPEALAELNEEAKRLKAREKRELARAHALIEGDGRAQRVYTLLLTIPGVGVVVGTVLVALFRRYRDQPQGGRGGGGVGCRRA